MNIVEQAEWLAYEFQPCETPGSIGRKIYRPAKWVMVRLRLLAMPPEIIEAARQGRLTEKQVERLTSTVLSVNRNRIFQEMMSCDNTEK